MDSETETEGQGSQALLAKLLTAIEYDGTDIGVLYGGSVRADLCLFYQELLNEASGRPRGALRVTNDKLDRIIALMEQQLAASAPAPAPATVAAAAAAAPEAFRPDAVVNGGTAYRHMQRFMELDGTGRAVAGANATSNLGDCVDTMERAVAKLTAVYDSAASKDGLGDVLEITLDLAECVRVMRARSTA
jgi:hypothetical protein